MPPEVPLWILAMIFGYSAAISIVSFARYKDYVFVPMIPSLIYMMFYFCFVNFIPIEQAMLWGRWGFLGLAASILVTKVWRYSYYLLDKNFLRGKVK